MKWTNERAEELRELEHLLHEIQAINRGSHVIERLQRCIELADKLDKTDIGRRHQSFVAFLRDLCIEDRSSAAGQGEQK
jgi:hypothetical protein